MAIVLGLLAAVTSAALDQCNLVQTSFGTVTSKHQNKINPLERFTNHFHVNDNSESKNLRLLCLTNPVRNTLLMATFKQNGWTTKVTIITTVQKVVLSKAFKFCIEGANGEAWIQYTHPTAVTVSQYAIVSANDDDSRDPSSWILQGSNDEIYFYELDRQTPNQPLFTERHQRRAFEIASPMPYLHYRLLFLSVLDSKVHLRR